MTKSKFSLLLAYVSYRESKEKLLIYQPNSSCAIICMFLSYFPEGFSRKFLVGMCRPVLQILSLFQTKKCYFPHPFSDLEMVTKHNITCLHKTEIMSSLLRLKPPQTSNSCYTFFLIPLELKRRTRWYTIVVPLLTKPDSRPIWAKSIPLFRPKRRKNPTLWGWHIPISLM